eukprot:TRINITY_DN10806_c1_g1_i1.p1 TRINITY_DN10806_c1_g1~~TRINITY_DN10806_c1_g1_i1.p1  ORF type:complete len:192 (+),score=52.06 TRINITY_DN10806_c1_g1_i1:106-681(+)
MADAVRRFLEFAVLDDERLVSCEELAAHFGLPLHEAHDCVAAFAQAHPGETFLYQTRIERPSIANGGVLRIRIRGSGADAPVPADVTCYAVAPIAWKSLHPTQGGFPALPHSHTAPDAAPPVITLPPEFRQQQQQRRQPPAPVVSKRGKPSRKRKTEQMAVQDPAVDADVVLLVDDMECDGLAADQAIVLD